MDTHPRIDQKRDRRLTFVRWLINVSTGDWGTGDGRKSKVNKLILGLLNLESDPLLGLKADNHHVSQHDEGCLYWITGNPRAPGVHGIYIRRH